MFPTNITGPEHSLRILTGIKQYSTPNKRKFFLISSHLNQANSQRNMTKEELLKLTQMSELAEKGTETVIINVFHMLRNLSRDIKDVEKTPYLVSC